MNKKYDVSAQPSKPVLYLHEINAHNARAIELNAAWRPAPWRMPSDKLPPDTGDLRQMIEAAYKRRHK
ncbi:MAG TPA: hypothetical protein VIJ38_01670 [Acidobacteriaceae bacterium]